MSRTMISFALVAVLAGVAQPHAQIPQGLFTEAFPAEEFAGRRERVFEAIGDGVAILQGAVEKSAELPFRQNTQFFYLTGVEVPRALLLMDGRTRRSTLFIPAAGFRAFADRPSGARVRRRG